jgi:hypothetical protein
MKCQLTGEFGDPDRKSGQPKSKVSFWELPCEEYDRVNIGDRVQLRPTGINTANLVSAP